jgi:hypothetical protein
MGRKITLSCILLMSLSLLLMARSGSGQEQAPVHATPLGIALDEYSYPYPVQFLTLNIDGQQLRMAYMDAAPKGWDGKRAAVLLHGKNFYGSYWENTIKALTAAGYRVIVSPCFGGGGPGGPPYSRTYAWGHTAPLFIPGFLAFLRQLPLGLGATHGAEDVDLLFVADKPFPKVLRSQETDVATGAGGAFGPHLVSPFGHISISLGSLRFATCPTRGLTLFFSKANHCQAGWQGNRSGQLPGEVMGFPAEPC